MSVGRTETLIPISALSAMTEQHGSSGGTVKLTASRGSLGPFPQSHKTNMTPLIQKLRSYISRHSGPEYYEIVGLLNEVERALKEQEWIPVEEQLPEEGIGVWVKAPDLRMPVSIGKWEYDAWTVLIGVGFAEAFCYEANVTHWRPLPTGPEE